MTAATQPSIEDIVLGAFPWIPKVHFYNPFLAADNGEDFMAHFHRAAKGKSNPFILVMEGSIPDETNKKEGYWASFGTDQATGQPITTCQWIDWLAPKAWAVMAAGTCATYGGIHAMEGNPTGCMGLPDYLGWQFRSQGDIPIVCVPGCPVQPDNFMETLLYLLHLAAGRAPMIALDDALRPTWLFGAAVHRKTGMLGPGGAVQCGQAWLDGGFGWMPQCWGNLHRMHHAGVSRQVHALHESAPGLPVVVRRRPNLWAGYSRLAPLYPGIAQ
jgi:hydrogenase small subunit